MNRSDLELHDDEPHGYTADEIQALWRDLGEQTLEVECVLSL